jgi:hypothetical protein
MMPSSSIRLDVVMALCWLSKVSMMAFSWASSAASSMAMPLRRAPASATMRIVVAACSPPITAVRALGQENRKRGS